MRQAIVNLNGSVLQSNIGQAVGTVGVGEVGTNYFYAVSMRTVSVNGTYEIFGESDYGAVLDAGTHEGTSNILTFSLVDGAFDYMVYKGTADADGTYLYKYVNLSGTQGTWIDETVYSVGTGGTIGAYNLAYTMGIYLTAPASYNADFDRARVTHRMQNQDYRYYNKGLVFNASLTYEQISEGEKNDMQTVYNWNADMRFFPNFDEKPNVWFDVAWQSAWVFPFTVPTFINGGYNGNMSLTGLYKLSAVSEWV